MTQHEYIFIAVSIILGLAITRLLHSAAIIARAHRRTRFHWASILWAFSILTYILQLWWVGWDLRSIQDWSFLDFVVLIFGSIFIYGSAEMALSVPNKKPLDMLQHNQNLGRASALSMLLYFLVGPYVNIFMLNNPVLPSLALPSIGILLMLLVIALPRLFVILSSMFAAYSCVILALTV
ncbi:MAG: hypothetical protein OXU66_12495 [Gammaproteobacteria bacterium]|nr:hypothetical protein [Gammaproteobacteria bacterium]MDD9897019.1 hypothetical protein [Gammaproteobacteria bacterium]MDD9959739.1 hypothetical protein [Gammaproteobacteria bacterium]